MQNWKHCLDRASAVDANGWTNFQLAFTLYRSLEWELFFHVFENTVSVFVRERARGSWGAMSKFIELIGNNRLM